jgi:hypothetical protein
VLGLHLDVLYHLRILVVLRMPDVCDILHDAPGCQACCPDGQSSSTHCSDFGSQGSSCSYRGALPRKFNPFHGDSFGRGAPAFGGQSLLNPLPRHVGHMVSEIGSLLLYGRDDLVLEALDEGAGRESCVRLELLANVAQVQIVLRHLCVIPRTLVGAGGSRHLLRAPPAGISLASRSRRLRAWTTSPRHVQRHPAGACASTRTP